jgi:hypothetical protein
MIWVSEEASRQMTESYEDAWIEDVLGWSWEDAEENLALCQREAKRKKFWKSHPHLRVFYWFIRRWYGAMSLFSRTVWRDWYGRITWSMAWKMSSDLWLTERPK